MAGNLIGIIIVFIIVVVIAAFVASTFNQMVQLRNKVKNSFAQMDAQLQRRFDLIPNLVETVKGYYVHEKEVLENVAASRSGYMNASSNREKLSMNSQLSSALKSLFAVTESYPDLKSNTNFLNLQNELSETEDKIVFARQFYNDTVTMYNNKIQMFPGNLVALIFRFEEEELFNADDDADNAPRVHFD